MKKLTILLSVLLAISLVLTGCSPGGEVASEEVENDVTEVGAPFKVCLITAASGLGDGSFNDSAHAGFKKAEEELGVEISVIEPKSVADYMQTLKLAASGDYDFIMAVGSDWTDAIDTVVPNYPDKNFGGINIKSEEDNLSVARFSDHEGSFLVGALAALNSKTGTIGFLGGMDIPAINRFAVGYEEGAMYVNPDIEVLISYVGAFTDPGKGKEFSIQLIDEGADHIFAAAGPSGQGFFEVLKTSDGVYGIGCDQDQDYIVEGKILTSMMKNVSAAAYDFIKQAKEGTITSGVHVYGIAEGGIGISEMKYTKEDVPSDVLEQIEIIKSEIVSGDIVVTDVFKQ